MNKPRVLITSASRKVWLIRAFQQAGWHVIAQDADPDAVALRFADERQCDININAWDADLIVPTRDAELDEFLRLSNHNDWKRVLVPNKETIRICTDKLAFYKFCKEHGFKTPEVYFVKPRISQSGKETECVWQEFVEGDEYSVDLFSDFQGNVISVVPRKRLKVVSGESWVTMTVHSPLLLEHSVALASKLGLIGHNVLQCFVTNQEVFWTDVNCRFGGASLCAIKAGCNSPLWLRELIEGKKVKPRIGEYEIGLRMYRYTEDLFVKEPI